MDIMVYKSDRDFIDYILINEEMIVRMSYLKLGNISFKLQYLSTYLLTARVCLPKNYIGTYGRTNPR